MTTADIKKIITDAFISDPEVIAKYGLEKDKSFEEQFSAVSLESILFDDMATAILLSVQQFDQFKIDIVDMLDRLKVHKPNWYATKAKLFQFGKQTVGDTDKYDNTGFTNEQIEASRIVKYAAAVEASDKSIMYLKVATGSEGNRQPLTNGQLIAFTDYMNRTGDGGVYIQIINDPADDMKLELDIYYNPLILDTQGKRLDGTNDTPIQDVINGYVDNLDFNGMYTNMKLIDSLQKVDGVIIPELKYVASRYGVYTEFKPINAYEIAHAGYYKISSQNLKLNFIRYE